MLCPLLPVTDVDRPLPADRDFIVRLQMALKSEARRMSQPAWDPGPVTGVYGPETARALDAFQRTLPVDTALDQLFRIAGRGYAGCATYRRLGLPCEGVVPVLGVTASDAIVAAMMVALSAQFGVPHIPCGPSVPPPPAPPGQPLGTAASRFWRALAILGGLGAGALVVWRVAKEGTR